MILSFTEMADAVALSVAFELRAEAEEVCGPEQAICEWVTERPDGDPNLEALTALIDAWSAEALAAVTLGMAA